MKTGIKILLLTVVYVITGKIGLRLAFVNASATAVWPPTGIALAALLMLGYRVWPGVFVGAFIVNLFTAGTVLTSLGVATGNTLEALLAAYLVNRFARGRDVFDHPYDILKYTVLAALGSTMIAATVGTLTLAAGGFARWTDFQSIWLTWWLGDAGGDLIVAPLLILWNTRPTFRWSYKQLSEAGLVTITLAFLGMIIFGGVFPSRSTPYPLDFLCIPVIVWAAFRLGRRQTAIAAFLLSTLAIWGTLNGHGPFVRTSPNDSLLLLQLYMGVVCAMSLAVAAVVSQRNHQLLASEKRYQQLLKSNIVGSMIIDWEGRVFDANDAFLDMLGYTRQDLKAGLLGGDAMTPQEYRVMDEWARAKIRESGVCPPLEKEYLRKDGSRVPVLVGVVFHEEPEQHLVCLVIDASDRRKAMNALRTAYDEMEIRVQQRTQELAAANEDLTREIERRKRAEAALQNLAITDPLTGLYNRRGFSTLADQLLKQSRRAREPFLVFVADLDGLKQINDTYGHLEGDQAVIALATILKDTFRASDVVARIGGDEFAVAVLNDVNDSDVEPLMDRLRQKVQAFNSRSRKSYDLSLSVGAVELKPHETRTLENLIAAADKLLYEEKRVKKTRTTEA